MRRATCPTELDEARVLASLGQYPAVEQCIVVLGLETGLRLSELCRLPVGSVWRDGACVSTLRVSRRHLKGGRVGAARARSTTSRDIPLNDHAREFIALYLQEREGAGPLSPQSPLFPGRDRRRSLSRVQAWRIIRTIFLRAGCDPAKTWSGHSLRRRFVRRVFLASNLEVARICANHRGAITTAIYLRADEDAAIAAQVILRIGRVPTSHADHAATPGEACGA